MVTYISWCCQMCYNCLHTNDNISKSTYATRMRLCQCTESRYACVIIPVFYRTGTSHKFRFYRSYTYLVEYCQGVQTVTHVKNLSLQWQFLQSNVN